MSAPSVSITHVAIVETELRFSLAELSRLCGADMETLETLVNEGVLTPESRTSTHWVFDGTALSRARRATRLLRDMEIDAAAAALVLDLLDEIEALRSQLRR